MRAVQFEEDGHCRESRRGEESIIMSLEKENENMHEFHGYISFKVVTEIGKHIYNNI